jgi:hypothetical protein
MPTFSLHNLSILNYANSFTLWHYRASPGDSPLDLEQSSFWEPAKTLIKPGDRIMISNGWLQIDLYVFRRDFSNGLDNHRYVRGLYTPESPSGQIHHDSTQV